MDVVWHQTIRPHCNLKFRTPILHEQLIEAVVLLAEESLLSPVSALRYVVWKAGHHHPCQSGHLGSQDEIRTPDLSQFEKIRVVSLYSVEICIVSLVSWKSVLCPSILAKSVLCPSILAGSRTGPPGPGTVSGGCIRRRAAAVSRSGSPPRRLLRGRGWSGPFGRRRRWDPRPGQI